MYFGWDMFVVSIDAGAQVAIILLAFGPCVVIVDYWDMFVLWVELPVQRRLCPIFVSGVRLSDIYEYSAVDRLSTDTPVLGRHSKRPVELSEIFVWV